MCTVGHRSVLYRHSVPRAPAPIFIYHYPPGLKSLVEMVSLCMRIAVSTHHKTMQVESMRMKEYMSLKLYKSTFPY